MSAEIEHFINETILPTISYKEGVKLTVAIVEEDFVARLSTMVPYVDDPHSRKVMVLRNTVLNKRLMQKLLEDDHVEDFRDYVINTFWGLVMQFETHEAEEWFRVNDEPWHEPHPAQSSVDVSD